MNRELRLAVLLVVAGSALLLLAAGRPWVDAVVPQELPLPAERVTRTGGDVVAGLSPLGLLGLAGVAALAATRRTGRVLVGALLAAAGTTAVLAVARALADGPTAPGVARTSDGGTGWPWVALAGGALLLAGGLLVAVRGRRWAALSRRYDAPAARRQAPETSAWDQLDRGEDPTRSGGDGRT